MVPASCTPSTWLGSGLGLGLGLGSGSGLGLGLGLGLGSGLGLGLGSGLGLVLHAQHLVEHVAITVLQRLHEQRDLRRGRRLAGAACCVPSRAAARRRHRTSWRAFGQLLPEGGRTWLALGLGLEG